LTWRSRFGYVCPRLGKKAEGGPGVLLRAYEMEGAPGESPIEFLGQTRRFREVNLLEEEASAQEQQLFHARPYEIKTIRLRIR
jgi:alpha-mannosidase